jgi:hypothetical protein
VLLMAGSDFDVDADEANSSRKVARTRSGNELTQGRPVPAANGGVMRYYLAHSQCANARDGGVMKRTTFTIVVEPRGDAFRRLCHFAEQAALDILLIVRDRPPLGPEALDLLTRLEAFIVSKNRTAESTNPALKDGAYSEVAHATSFCFDGCPTARLHRLAPA